MNIWCFCVPFILSTAVKHHFDERSLFPKYILEYESRMRAQNRAEFGGDDDDVKVPKPKAQKNRFKSWGTVASTTTSGFGQGRSGNMPQNKPPARLDPLPEARKPKLIAQEMG